MGVYLGSGNSEEPQVMQHTCPLDEVQGSRAPRPQDCLQGSSLLDPVGSLNILFAFLHPFPSRWNCVLRDEERGWRGNKNVLTSASTAPLKPSSLKLPTIFVIKAIKSNGPFSASVSNQVSLVTNDRKQLKLTSEKQKGIYRSQNVKVPAFWLFTRCSSEIPGMESHWSGRFTCHPCAHRGHTLIVCNWTTY